MSILTEHEILYSPTRWVKRMDPEDIISFHCKFAAEKSEEAKRTIPCELNVPYGNRKDEKYDLFGTDLPKGSPIFIFIHGGYWQELSRDISSYVVQPFYKNGFKTIIIGYTLCPTVSLNDIVCEIKMAFLKCIDYANECGTQNIYVSGYSAGAQLITSMFSTLLPELSDSNRNLFKSFILCCGVYDLTPLINTYINDPLQLDIATARSLSPMFHDVPILDMDVYIAIGENDTPAFKEQSIKYYNKLKRFTNVSFKVIDNVDHFSIVENLSDEKYELCQYIFDKEKKNCKTK